MLKWAVIFFVILIVAGFLGFSGIAAGASTIAKWLFLAAIAVFLLFVVLAFLAGEVIL